MEETPAMHSDALPPLESHNGPPRTTAWNATSGTSQLGTTIKVAPLDRTMRSCGGT